MHFLTELKITDAILDGLRLSVHLNDGRIVIYPMAGMDWITDAPEELRTSFTVDEWEIYWEDIDDGLTLEHILSPKPRVDFTVESTPNWRRFQTVIDGRNNSETDIIENGEKMAITKGYKQLIEEAEAVVKTYTVEDVQGLTDQENIVLVDIRDVRELQKLGKIPGAIHAPRGMLEFWVDPESPYYRENLADDSKEYILYCGSGWRSALAGKALHDMGLTNYAHMGGGFSGWSEAGGDVEKKE